MAGPSNKERIDGHDGRLTQIEAALELKSHQPKKNFLVQKYEWAVNHKTLSIFLCVFSIFGGGYFKYYLDHRNDGFNRSVDDRVDAKLVQPNIKLGELGERLARVEGKLDTIIALSSLTASKQYAKRGDVTLAIKAASDAHAALLRAVAEKVIISPSIFPRLRCHSRRVGSASSLVSGIIEATA